MNEKKRAAQNFFWPGYADLMTSLFFVTLVLFVLSFVQMWLEKERYRVDAEMFRRIKQVNKDVEDLTETGRFSWDSTYKRLNMTQHIQYIRSDFVIRENSDINYLLKVGGDVKKLVDSAVARDKSSRYLILLEGMASRDNSDRNMNFELSYKRARNVLELWERNNIRFDPAFCEVLIAGSGLDGVGRDSSNEEKNQRVLVQIIPKVWQSSKK